jgi:hypothetical protein
MDDRESGKIIKSSKQKKIPEHRFLGKINGKRKLQDLIFIDTTFKGW